MPTYRYRCGECGDEFEVWQSFQDEPLTSHDGCGGPVVKVLTPAGIVLKGPGFYKTDSRGGAKSDGDKGSEKKAEPKKDGDSGSGSSSKESGGSSSSPPASTPASTKTT